MAFLLRIKITSSLKFVFIEPNYMILKPEVFLFLKKDFLLV